MPPGGILKADWLAKHCGRRPAVLLLLLERERVVGDPNSWAGVAQHIEALKGAAKGIGARAAVAVHAPAAPETSSNAAGEALAPAATAAGGDLPDDRAAMICRHAGVDRRCVVALRLGDEAAVAALGAMLREQSMVHYGEEAQRRLAKHTQRNLASAERGIRMAFKVRG